MGTVGHVREHRGTITPFRTLTLLYAMSTIFFMLIPSLRLCMDGLCSSVGGLSLSGSSSTWATGSASPDAHHHIADTWKRVLELSLSSFGAMIG